MSNNITISSQEDKILKKTDLCIGICGGTFDPVHLGHLVLAEQVRENFELDKVYFIPSGNPPHKDNSKVTHAKHRFRMVQEAVKSNPYFEVSSIEIDREGYTYTVDTLQQLKAMLCEDVKIYFIMGADVIFDLLSWREYTEVFTLCEFIAVLRPGYNKQKFIREITMLKSDHGAVIHTVEAPLVDISSTDVREKVRKGQSIKYLVPQEVEKYIHSKKLYV